MVAGVTGVTGQIAPNHAVEVFKLGRETVTILFQSRTGGSVRGWALKSSAVTQTTVQVGRWRLWPPFINLSINVSRSSCKRRGTKRHTCDSWKCLTVCGKSQCRTDHDNCDDWNWSNMNFSGKKRVIFYEVNAKRFCKRLICFFYSMISMIFVYVLTCTEFFDCLCLMNSLRFV